MEPFADSKINVTEKLKFLLGREEKLGKQGGENPGHPFFLSP